MPAPTLGTPITAFTSPTFNGVAVTQLGTIIGNSTRQYLYYVFNPTPGVSRTFAATKSVNGYWTVTAVPIFGSDTSSQGNAFGTFAQAPGGLAVTSDTNSLVIDFLAHRYIDLDTFTVGAGQTLLTSVETTGRTGPNSFRCYSSTEAGAASVTMSWTRSGNNSDWSQISVGLKGVSGGGTHHQALITARRRRMALNL